MLRSRLPYDIARLGIINPQLVQFDDMHPYFVGTQAHPELTSRPLRTSPLFMGFVKAAMEYAADGKRAEVQTV